MTKLHSFLLLLLLAGSNCVSAQPRSLSLDERHLLLDGSLSDVEAAARPFTYNTFQQAAAHFGDSCTLYIKPWVYWIDNPDTPAVVTGRNGREPFGMVVTAKKLRLVGLTDDARHVVLASQRGQTQGAVGNFTMFDFHVDTLTVEHLTMGNYCNVDLDYPLRPDLSRRKRNSTITQAHVGYVHGHRLVAKDARFISRLNLNPLNGAQESYYEDCHFECTDDALNGNAVYRHCDVDLYGQKPFWSTYGRGAMFIDCDFYVRGENREMYFCKQGGPLTLVDCRYHAPSDSIYIGWTAYPQPWLRCYQQNFTLNGCPYVVGSLQQQNTVQLSSKPASGVLDSRAVPFMNLSQHDASLQTGADTLLLTASGYGSGHERQGLHWRVQPGYESFVELRPGNAGPAGADVVTVVPTNTTDETAAFCIEALTADGLQAACHLTVKPSELPPPAFRRQPRIVVKKGVARLDYQLDLQGRRDESSITWMRDGIPVSVTHLSPEREYRLTPADVGHVLSAAIKPKHHRSTYGQEALATMKTAVTAKTTGSEQSLETDFHDFPCQWQPVVVPGLWTVDGYKPVDTAEFPWEFSEDKPMWEYHEGFNGAVGFGLLQAQRGARLMYTPVSDSCGDMELTLQVDPTKTAGQGFGSATGQYMDVCLKFDTRSLTGYGLRIVRTTKHAKAVDFLLVRYDRGVVTPVSESVSSTCYRTGCTISLIARADRLTAHVESATPAPRGSQLPHVVDLSATIAPNAFGGIHIQHTGSCGESTTMLHCLQARWQ